MWFMMYSSDAFWKDIFNNPEKSFHIFVKIHDYAGIESHEEYPVAI